MAAHSSCAAQSVCAPCLRAQPLTCLPLRMKGVLVDEEIVLPIHFVLQGPASRVVDAQTEFIGELLQAH